MGPNTCPHCSYPLDRNLDHCPVCGILIRKRKPGPVPGRLIAVATVLVLLVLAIDLFLDKQREERRLEEERIAAREERQRRTDFIRNIEKHYRILEDLHERKKIMQARAKLYLFKRYGQLDYRDVRAIQTRVLIASLEERVEKIPESDAKGRLGIYERLMELDPKNPLYKERHSLYERRLRP